MKVYTYKHSIYNIEASNFYLTPYQLYNLDKPLSQSSSVVIVIIVINIVANIINHYDEP